MYIEHVFKERFTKGVRWYVKVPKIQSFVGWNAAYIRLITKHLQQALAFIFVTIVYPNIDKHVSIKRQQQTFYIHLITFVFFFFFGHTTENESNIQQSVNTYDYKQLRKVCAFFPSQIIDEFWGWWGYLFLTISNAKLKMDLWWKRKLNKLTWYSQWVCNIEQPLNNSMNSLTRVASKKNYLWHNKKNTTAFFVNLSVKFFLIINLFFKKLTFISFITLEVVVHVLQWQK